LELCGNELMDLLATGIH